MATNTLNTRIALKIDTLSTWMSSTFKPYAGEVCIAKVDTVEGSTLQPVMIKVGDNEHTFAELDWISAKAADVYGWAKAKDVVLDGQILKFKAADGTELKTVDLSVFTTADELATALGAHYTKTEVDNLLANKVDKATGKSLIDDTLITKVEGIEAGAEVNIIETVKVNGVALTPDENRAVNVEFDIPTEDEIKSLAAGEINRLIAASDDEGGETIQNIANLVDYVEKNAGEIAGLVTAVGTANANASTAVETANNAATTAGQALEKANEALAGAEGAAASASAASASAQAAKASEEAAAASAETASAKAGEASTSASNAATSESNAQGYANDASASAGEAASSANAAAGSATEALGYSQTANQAKADAIAAKDASAQSETNAKAAQTAAEAAQVKAEEAQAAAEASNTSATAIANEAKATAEDAATTAGEAKTAAEAATNAVAGLHAIATSGNVNDLTQTAGDYLIFNCGTATTII